MLEWEMILNNKYDYIERMKIHGGWLVRDTTAEDAMLVFTPDPEHEWLVEKENADSV